MHLTQAYAYPHTSHTCTLPYVYFHLHKSHMHTPTYVLPLTQATHVYSHRCTSPCTLPYVYFHMHTSHACKRPTHDFESERPIVQQDSIQETFLRVLRVKINIILYLRRHYSRKHYSKTIILHNKGGDTSLGESSSLFLNSLGYLERHHLFEDDSTSLFEGIQLLLISLAQRILSNPHLISNLYLFKFLFLSLHLDLGRNCLLLFSVSTVLDLHAFRIHEVKRFPWILPMQAFSTHQLSPSNKLSIQSNGTCWRPKERHARVAMPPH